MRAKTTTLIAILVTGLLAVSAVGVAAQAEEAADPMAPAQFKVDYDGEPASFLEATFAETEFGESIRGDGIVDIPLTAGDPRASGLLTEIGNQEILGNGVITSSRLRIVNDDGAWEGTSMGALRLKNKQGQGNPYNRGASVATLAGEGAYEGLTLVLAQTLDEWQGYIVPTAVLPPLPELPAE